MSIDLTVLTPRHITRAWVREHYDITEEGKLLEEDLRTGSIDIGHELASDEYTPGEFLTEIKLILAISVFLILCFRRLIRLRLNDLE